MLNDRRFPPSSSTEIHWLCRPCVWAIAIVDPFRCRCVWFLAQPGCSPGNSHDFCINKHLDIYDKRSRAEILQGIQLRFNRCSDWLNIDGLVFHTTEEAVRRDQTRRFNYKFISLACSCVVNKSCSSWRYRFSFVQKCVTRSSKIRCNALDSSRCFSKALALCLCLTKSCSHWSIVWMICILISSVELWLDFPRAFVWSRRWWLSHESYGREEACWRSSLGMCWVQIGQTAAKETKQEFSLLTLE